MVAETKKKIIKDVLLNIVATALPIIILQLIIQPIVAKRVGSESYGLMLTLIGVFQIGRGVFGNSLNNIRLLSDRQYREAQLVGDFNILLVSGIGANIILLIGATWYYQGSFDVIAILWIVAIGTIELINIYLSVTYRLRLNYRDMLIFNVFVGLGYLIGLVCNLYKTRLLTEPFKKTQLFKHTRSRYVSLLLAVGLSSIVLYFDRILLYPLWGGTQVSIYFSASIVGKILLKGVEPMTNVFLSHVVKLDKIDTKRYLKMFVLFLVLCVLGYLLCLVISTPLIRLLYPDWAEESLQYVPYTVGTAIFTIMMSVMNPILLRFTHMYWQIILKAIYAVSYIGVIFIAATYGSLMQFSIGVMIISALIVILMFPMSIYAIRSNQEKSDLLN
jgi:O-antigen/teichoic acid export membrane protein